MCQKEGLAAGTILRFTPILCLPLYPSCLTTFVREIRMGFRCILSLWTSTTPGAHGRRLCPLKSTSKCARLSVLKGRRLIFVVVVVSPAAATASSVDQTIVWFIAAVYLSGRARRVIECAATATAASWTTRPWPRRSRSPRAPSSTPPRHRPLLRRRQGRGGERQYAISSHSARGNLTSMRSTRSPNT